MRTLLLADIHTRKPSELVHKLTRERGIGAVVFLGDVDTPDVLKNLLNAIKQNNLQIVYTPGNHEYHFTHREKGIGGWQTYARIWDKSPEEKKFVLDSSEINSSRKSLIVADREVVYAHASVMGGPSVPNPQVSDIVWGRLQNNNDLLALNFKIMRDLDDFRIFFRGHDHHPAISTYDYNQTRTLKDFQGTFKFEPDKFLSIATVGAFVNGFYAIYDSDKQEIDFRKER